MPNTLLGFGIFALVAAIVGGGLKGLGFEVGVLKSTTRQLLLAAVGVALIASGLWSQIPAVPHAPQMMTERVGPRTIETGRVYSIPLSLNSSGPVDVEIESLTPDWAGFSGQRGMPGQDGLYVTICASQSGGPCPSRQMGASQPFRQELPAGPGTISIFNFASSPRMTFTLRIKHPE